MAPDPAAQPDSSLDRYSRQTRFPALGEARLRKPWIFGGVIGSEGQTMTILPGKTPCIRCVIETSPPPGMTPTCETAGVLGPAVAVIASFEAVEAIKLLSGAFDALNTELIMVDVWDWTFRRLK